jgi:hypothetical protein
MVAPTSVIDVFKGEAELDGWTVWHQNFQSPKGVQAGAVMTYTYDETAGASSKYTSQCPTGTPVYASDGQFMWMVWGP